MVKLVTLRLTHAKEHVERRKIVLVTNRPVTLAQAIVKEVSFFQEQLLRFMISFQECYKNSECRNGKLCDTLTNRCRNPCEEKKHCNGTRQTCYKNTGFCTKGEYLFSISTSTIRGSCFVLKNAKQILTAYMEKLVIQ